MRTRPPTEVITPHGCSLAVLIVARERGAERVEVPHVVVAQMVQGHGRLVRAAVRVRLEHLASRDAQPRGRRALFERQHPRQEHAHLATDGDDEEVVAAPIPVVRVDVTTSSRVVQQEDVRGLRRGHQLFERRPPCHDPEREEAFLLLRGGLAGGVLQRFQFMHRFFEAQLDRSHRDLLPLQQHFRRASPSLPIW